MKAMILAAGRGERLRPLTDTTPKPLLPVGDKCLIEHHLQKLAEAGIKEVIINTAWLGQQIHKKLGTGKKYGLAISYSDEGEQALETAGGIIKALPLLGDEAFLVVNGDIWCDFNFSKLVNKKIHTLAHLVLVDNPDHNHKGDFALEQGLLKNTGDSMHTYSGMGIYTPAFFDGLKAGIQPLAPLLREKIENRLVSGELHDGQWTDVGTAERLQILNNTVNSKHG